MDGPFGQVQGIHDFQGMERDVGITFSFELEPTQVRGPAHQDHFQNGKRESESVFLGHEGDLSGQPLSIPGRQRPVPETNFPFLGGSTARP